jgi:hypothetical protein
VLTIPVLVADIINPVGLSDSACSAVRVALGICVIYVPLSGAFPKTGGAPFPDPLIMTCAGRKVANATVPTTTDVATIFLQYVLSGVIIRIQNT